MARRSMRLAKNLRQIADQYRANYLDSNDSKDRTKIDTDWQSMQRSPGDALGGSYLAVHFRRQDFVRYKSNRVPDLDCAIQQIHFFASNAFDLHFERIYIATDTDSAEWIQLKSRLEQKKHRVFNFETDFLSNSGLHPGEVAIIDQWICAHARVFIGTLDSNFSNQIQEEREILGFATNTTFNALCPQCDLRLMLKICKQESTWKIVY